LAHLESLMRRHFVEYASYFILDRAIPDLRDGLKPVQRRLLHTLFTVNDGRYHKVANVIGETMKLHPHGDAAIGDALVVLANKGLFIDRQGNFGSLLTGHPAAAPRYIECRLTDLALETLFDPDLTEWQPSYDGRNREPVFLPVKLPVALLLGAEGIAVGMATRILPHNLRELWEAQVAVLEGRDFELLPDFAQGGTMDASEYDDGRGKVELRAVLEKRDARRLVVREIPFGTTTEGLIASIEAAAQRGRVKVASIDDFTTDRVEIEITLQRGVDADEVIPQLYAYTDCRVVVSSNVVLVDERRPVTMAVSEVLRRLTEQLVERLRAELEHARARLEDRRHRLTLERIFVEERVYKEIERATSAEAVTRAVWQGMHRHEELFVRPMVEEDVERLLEIRIRRISAWDIERNRSQVRETQARIAEVEAKLSDMTRTTVEFVRELLAKYGERFPRRTRLRSLEAVDRKAVAAPTLKLAYDEATGFFGHAVRGEAHRLQVSEFDLVLGIAEDGSYRIMTAPEKVLFPARLLHVQVFDPEEGARFTLVYRDAERRAFAKKVQIRRFVRNREYQLAKDGRLDVLLPGHVDGTVELRFAPAKRQRVKDASFDLAELAPTGVAARGTRLAPKPVSRVRYRPPDAPAPRRRPSKPSKKAGSTARSSPKPAAKRSAKKKAAAQRPARPTPPKPPGGSQGTLF